MIYADYIWQWIWQIFNNLLWKLSLHPTHILLHNLSVPYLMFHFSRLPRVSPKHEKARCEPVQPMDGSQILQVVFLGEDEDHGVVSVTATGMHLDKDMVNNIYNIVNNKPSMSWPVTTSTLYLVLVRFQSQSHHHLYSHLHNSISSITISSLPNCLIRSGTSSATR